MRFESAAKEIVANSIRSAICIDDEFVEPYAKAKDKPNDSDMPKRLRDSFRKSNCSLDIYTYTGCPKIREESEFVFNNRDLLILDWELTGDPVKFKDALDILKDAVDNPGLAFVLIYTKEPYLAGIEIQIRSFFNQKAKSKKERDEIYDRLLSTLDKEFFLNEEFFLKEAGDNIPDDTEKFLNDIKIKDVFKEFVLGEPSDDAEKRFEAGLSGYFPDQDTGKKFLRLFKKSVKETYGCSNLFEGCEQIEFYNRSSYIRPGSFSPAHYCHKIHSQENALWVNNTYIVIFNKDVSPESVYERFSGCLCRKPGNIMTLIALEMKNHFRENSGKVGKDLLAVDELAFFHHGRTLDDQEEFYDFLRNNWKHQLASFYLSSDSKVFPVLDEYKHIKRIDEKIDKKKGNNTEAFRKELAKLNYQYSFYHVKRKEKDFIRFGDIFNLRESASDGEAESYLLNITAHCDCLRPDKTDYHFHFVRGTIALPETALKYATSDDYCFSFFYSDNDSDTEPRCISWKNKPFTIFIPEEKRFFSKDNRIEVKIGEASVYLFFKGTLLENYTQRIANKSFAHASRVGIDLAEWKKESKKEAKK